MTREPERAAATLTEEDEPLRRIIGHLTGDQPGPTLICIGGVHGNEPAGVRALRRVFQTLEANRPPLRGQFVGLVGNIAALAAQRRYLDRDLNRRWLPKTLDKLVDGLDPAATLPEDRECCELLAELDRLFQKSAGDVFIIDLHTTSGESTPFVVMGDTLRNREFALKFPLPLVLGLEEYLDGTISEYLTSRGHVTITVETGQHDSPAAVDHAEAAIWTALTSLGIIERRSDPNVIGSAKRLAQAADSLPRILEVLYRHPVSKRDAFRMEPGFLNFQPIQPGHLLARDRTGEVRSRWQGRILMPLYQELGEDGFFIVREFTPAWLKVSALLRHLRLDAMAHWLPGISRHPTRPGTFVVDRKIARWYTTELLHLLGFRRRRAVGDVILVSRRRHSRPGR